MALDNLDPKRKGTSKNRVKDEARLSEARMNRAVHRLVRDQVVKETTVTVGIGSKAKRKVAGLVRKPLEVKE